MQKPSTSAMLGTWGKQTAYKTKEGCGRIGKFYWHSSRQIEVKTTTTQNGRLAQTAIFLGGPTSMTNANMAV